MSAIVLDYVPQPKQQLLHATTAKQIFFGGAAGGGKTKALRWDAIAFCLRNPNCTAVLFRRTLPQLEQNHIIWIRRELPESIGRFNETRKRFEFKNGSLLIFKHLEHEQDVEDIQGWEIHWAGVDEGAQMTPYQLAYIRSRIRLGSWKAADTEDAKRLPRFVIASNPGGISHTFLKNSFIKPSPPGELFFDATLKDEKDPNDKGWPSIFIPAAMKDNAYLDAGYASSFKQLPEWMQRQLVEGDWDVVPGAFFECWSRDNIIKPFEVPERWLRFQAMDWGFATPFCIGEYVVSDGEAVTNKAGEEVTYPEGAMIKVWEWYGSRNGFGNGNVGLRRDASEIASDLKVMRPHRIDYRVADESIWRTDSGPSVGEKFSKAGISWNPAERERIPGWQEMYRRIANGMLLVFENCTTTTQCIPQLEADESKPEDVKKEGEDHPGDETRYACMSRPWKVKKPLPKKELVQPLTFNDLMRPERIRHRYERRI